MEVYLAVKETADPTITPLYSQVLVGLANYLSRGYLRLPSVTNKPHSPKS